MLVDFVLNSLDRKINCFLLRDTTRGVTADGRKYASVAMIDNEGAGWTAYGVGRVRRHTKVLHYRNDKHYHGWKDKEGLRYAIEKERVDGSAGRQRKCNFCPPRLHRNAIAKFGMEDVVAARRREERQPETKLSSRLLAALMVSRRVHALEAFLALLGERRVRDACATRARRVRDACAPRGTAPPAPLRSHAAPSHCMSGEPTGRDKALCPTWRDRCRVARHGVID